MKQIELFPDGPCFGFFTGPVSFENNSPVIVCLSVKGRGFGFNTRKVLDPNPYDPCFVLLDPVRRPDSRMARLWNTGLMPYCSVVRGSKSVEILPATNVCEQPRPTPHSGVSRETLRTIIKQKDLQLQQQLQLQPLLQQQCVRAPVTSADITVPELLAKDASTHDSEVGGFYDPGYARPIYDALKGALKGRGFPEITKRSVAVWLLSVPTRRH